MARRSLDFVSASEAAKAFLASASTSDREAVRPSPPSAPTPATAEAPQRPQTHHAADCCFGDRADDDPRGRKRSNAAQRGRRRSPVIASPNATRTRAQFGWSARTPPVPSRRTSCSNRPDSWRATYPRRQVALQARRLRQNTLAIATKRTRVVASRCTGFAGHSSEVRTTSPTKNPTTPPCRGPCVRYVNRVAIGVAIHK